MIDAGIRQRQQQEDQIDRQAVDRLEIDRLREAGEIAEHAGQAFDLSVRDGDAAAEAGRADLLAGIEAGDDVLGGNAARPPGRIGELLDQRLLVGGNQVVVDGVDGKDGGKVAHKCPIGL